MLRTFTLLAALSCAACTPKQAALPPGPAAPRADAVASRTAAAPAPAASASLTLVNNYLAALNAHDIDRAGNFLAEDVEYFDASFAGLQHGREAAISRGIGVFLRGVPDLHWEMRSAPIHSADGVAFEWTFTGTNTGTWGGVPASNQKINLKGIAFIRIRNGKISHQAMYYDSGALNRQLGW